jgi:anti-sigma B factor antagonist
LGRGDLQKTCEVQAPLREEIQGAVWQRTWLLSGGRPAVSKVMAIAQPTDVRVFAVPERVDAYNTRDLVGPVKEAIDAGGRCIVLDFSRTQSMDSTALGALVQMLKTLRSNGGELRLASVGDAVSRVLSITRLDQVFSIYATLDAARTFARP